MKGKVESISILLNEWRQKMNEYPSTAWTIKEKVGEEIWETQISVTKPVKTCLYEKIYDVFVFLCL